MGRDRHPGKRRSYRASAASVPATPVRGVRTTSRRRRRAATIYAKVDTSCAHAIAVRLLSRAREPDGTLLLAHVRRVVAGTPPEAHVVAWLHEVLETGAITEQELLAEGLTSDELRALRLLTRSGGSRSDSVYLEHLELIARAAGLSGHLARLVKLADLQDRRSHPRRRPDGWSPPYARGYRLLREAEIAAG
jgi:hypothetical protein